MNKKVLFLFVALLIFLSLGVQVHAVNLNPYVYSQWHLNETTGNVVMDSSWNGRNGTTVNAPLWVAGKIGNALQFNGVNQSVNLGNSSFSFERTQAVSYEFWVYTASSASSMMLLTRWNNSLSRGMFVWSQGRNVTFGLYANGSSSLVVIANSTFSQSVWHHVVVTYDGSSLASGVGIYLDGVLQNKSISSNNLAGSVLVASNFTVASRSDGYPFNGLMDEIVIYNKTLTADEVSFRYNNGTGTESLGSILDPSSYMHIAINGSESDQIKAYPNATNVTAWKTLADDGGCSYNLYRNGVLVGNPDISSLVVGNYTYIYNTSGCTNYTGGSVARILNITKNSVSLSLSNNISWSGVYPVASSTSGSGCPSELTCSLYRNGSLVSNPDSVLLGAGIWSYVYNTSGDSNYSSGSTSNLLDISKSPASLSLSNNISWSGIYPEGSSTSGSGCPSGLTCNLYRNGSLVSNPDNALLGVGVYPYVYNTSGNSNYSGGSASNVLSISALPSNLTVSYPSDVAEEGNYSVIAYYASNGTLITDATVTICYTFVTPTCDNMTELGDGYYFNFTFDGSVGGLVFFNVTASKPDYQTQNASFYISFFDADLNIRFWSDTNMTVPYFNNFLWVYAKPHCDAWTQVMYLGLLNACNSTYMHAKYVNGSAELHIWTPDTYDLYLVDGSVTWDNSSSPPTVASYNDWLKFDEIAISSSGDTNLDYFWNTTVEGQYPLFSDLDWNFWLSIGGIVILIIVAGLCAYFTENAVATLFIIILVYILLKLFGILTGRIFWIF